MVFYEDQCCLQLVVVVFDFERLVGLDIEGGVGFVDLQYFKCVVFGGVIYMVLDDGSCKIGCIVVVGVGVMFLIEIIELICVYGMIRKVFVEGLVMKLVDISFVFVYQVGFGKNECVSVDFDEWYVFCCGDFEELQSFVIYCQIVFE